LQVAQLTGAVGERSAYHHGEASLQSTIVGLAQNFVGSNNINLLYPSGQFGTRLQGGKDAASARYIFTRLAPLARKLFREEDDALLDYQFEEGLWIEPTWYVSEALADCDSQAALCIAPGSVFVCFSVVLGAIGSLRLLSILADHCVCFPRPIVTASVSMHENVLIRGILKEKHCNEWNVFRYLPILPMVLVNGAEGIGTGWSTSIPNYNPLDIVANIRKLLDDEEPVEMTPWYRFYQGEIYEVPAARNQASKSFQVSGIIAQVCAFSHQQDSL
jgi:hypothetical protein